ncbi:protein PFF0380w-like isoform X10 [Myzus persicae]|uniref:protein PFF0380w-like isoform X10 n=1 Tax=Myzus persicae TaxID=13164 RepID=UPI000B937E4C|nr:protein PFF0380w-like isoform X10 [Myzus persicae]
MSPSNSKLSSDRETVSCIQNKNGKRSFFRTSETDVTDNDIYYKRKKSIKHSQSEINNAVLTAQNGYMTRNKLKKQLTNNSELVETSVIKDKCSRINNIRNKSETANRNRKPSKKIHKKMLQLGFVFTNDISSPYPGKHLDTEYKKSTPSLFESDSDPEIDYFRIKDSVKDEVEEISTCISDPDDICPAFDKNVEMRTYFNKKSYPINNKSNIISLNTFEEIDQKPSSLYDPVKTVRDSNLYKNISQNYSKTNKSLEVTADSASMSKNTTINKPISIELNEKNCVNFNKNEISPTTSECVPTNTEDGEIIVVTESFISQLKNEFEITKTESQAEIRTQELFYDNNTNKSNDFDKENKVVSKILSSDFEVNQINMCAIDTDIDDICDVNFKSSICSNLLLKQDMDVIDDSHNKPLPSLFTTTNNVENSLMSIFDEPKENILVESYASINNSLIIDSKSNSSTTISEEIIDLSSLHTFEFDNSNSDQPVENYPKPEKNITCPDLIEPNQYFHSIIKDEIKIKTESFYIKDNYNCSLKNDSLSSTNDSFSKKYKNHSSRCYCKNFNSFNINDNKIFTSKIKHFAFNNNAKKVRQKLLLRKHLEANILNMLITKEHKNIIQSREHNIPIFNSISINKKFEKFDFKENDHIEPSILSMLKDVYVDVEYLTEYCDYNTSDHKLLEPQKDNKDIQFNIHSSKVKSINIMSTSKNINDSTSNNTSQNKPINFKPYDEKYDNFDKNKINNDSTSNITKQKKTVYIKPFDGSYVNFNKKKTIDHANTSNSTTKYEPINENDVNHEKYKIIDALISNSKTKIKPISIEPDEKNCANFNKNVINYPKVSFIKKNDLDFDSVCNSLVVNTEIDTKSKIKIEDEFYYDTTAMKYDFKSEENPELEIKLFDVSNLSDSTITINKNNESKKEFEMPVKCNDIESENILSSARIKTNYEFTQTKITHVLKEEHTPVPAIIESEIEKTNISTFFEPPQFKNLFDTSDTISPKAYQMCPMLPHTSENNEPVNNLFDLPVDDIAFSLNNNSSDDDDDDDNRLLIEDNEPIVDGNINTNKTCIFKLPDNSKDERKINYPSSAANIKSKVTTEIEFCEKNLTNTKKEQSSEINLIENEEVSNPILSTKKCVISNNNCENAYLLKEKENSLDDCMSFEMCNEFYKIKSLNKSIVNKNESLPKYIQDILKEMYVDELFVSTCQHMVDFYNDDDQLKNNVFFQTDKCRIIPSKKLACDIINTKVAEKKYSEFNQSISINGETLLGAKINYENQETNEPSNTTTKENNSVSLQKPNDVKTKYPELKQSISTKGETILKSEINNRNQQKKTVNPTITKQKSNSLQEAKNVPSNMKIRIHLREFIVSDKSFDDILESKEFRNLRFFGEEEIASSIGVFIFEQIIDAPIITGLSVYRASYDQLNNEEKNKILASTNLNITCPKIMMLTSITLALAKMLRSDTLIELILNVIRRNILKKQMNTNHSIDDQLIKQVVYFVDICVRLRLLKTLQIFIFDSMVFLPNKYCCIIFISLLLWKNCLPRSINIKEDPVIITVLSFLIAKKKHYSEETVGCDIFQRELINLLSCHFNYTFSIDMPTNFIQHIHKPDFFVSVVMFLKCCNPNDLVEFMVNCLFPIVDNYLNTQQNEMYALQTMESINMAIVPFKITCNTTVATYLNKCKDPINGLKKNGKEHVYNTTHNSYKILQNKFIEYLNDSRPRSPYFEELLMSIILVLGSADYLTSCMSLMQWKPKNELSAILSKKIVIFKSIVGDNIVWDKLCAIDDINTLKCLINSCLLNKNVYDTIIQLYNLR